MRASGLPQVWRLDGFEVLFVRCPLRRSSKWCYKADEPCVCVCVCVLYALGCHTSGVWVEYISHLGWLGCPKGGLPFGGYPIQKASDIYLFDLLHLVKLTLQHWTRAKIPMCLGEAHPWRHCTHSIVLPYDTPCWLNSVYLYSISLHESALQRLCFPRTITQIAAQREHPLFCTDVLFQLDDDSESSSSSSDSSSDGD